MPQFSLDIEKRLGSEFWSNRYLVQSPNIAAAQEFGDEVVAYERAMHATSVTFTRFRVSAIDPNTEVYSIVAIGLEGLRSPPASLLPLFNTLRLDINAAIGRPSRKYYRGVLAESDIAGDAVTTSFTAFVLPLVGFILPTLEGSYINGPQGEDLVSVIVHPYVQMRQLRRSRRRRTNGGGIFQ